MNIQVLLYYSLHEWEIPGIYEYIKRMYIWRNSIIVLIICYPKFKSKPSWKIEAKTKNIQIYDGFRREVLLGVKVNHLVAQVPLFSFYLVRSLIPVLGIETPVVALVVLFLILTFNCINGTIYSS